MKCRIARIAKARYIQPSRRKISFYLNDPVFSQNNYKVFYRLKTARDTLLSLKKDQFYDYSIQIIKEYNGSTNVRWSKI